MSNKRILNSNETHEAKDYPYGRLRTSMFYSLDFHPKKGFRAVTQSINPKNGRLNKPHPSTYSFFRYIYENTDNGHFEFGGFSSYGGFAEVKQACTFIAEHFDALHLTREQVKSISSHLFTLLRGNSVYSGIEKEKQDALIALVKPTVDLLLKAIENGNNVFADINLDVEAIEALKKPLEQQVQERVQEMKEARFVSSEPVAG